MSQEQERSPRVEDHSPESSQLLEDVLVGLRGDPRTLPCKLLYDRIGAQLFERICEVDEYYPTRTEIGILRANASEMSAAIGARALVVEFGSGEGVKTRLLLGALDAPVAYVPIDISKEQLRQTSKSLATEFPELRVEPVCADYTTRVSLPDSVDDAENVAVFLPGSTIGNFVPAEAIEFLARVARLVGPGGGLLIGVDLQKETDRLIAAYDDAEGVTAAFNLNILAHLKRELGADLSLDGWSHEARWNGDAGRIEMHLVSTRAQTIDLAGESFAFAAGDSIHTENSYKYTRDSFADVARKAGFSVDAVWTDADALFSVQFLRAGG